MITLVTGGSGSGKSAYAEEVLSSCEGTKYYIATMQIYDAEGEQKVKRHRELRAGKGFLTVESPRNVGQIFFPSGERNAALLECMSNLTANEMFTPDGITEESQTVTKIIKEIQILSGQVDHLVIVTNNVFEDGIVYDEGTMAYLRALGRIITELAKLADRVVEVVVGIPVQIK